VSLSAPVPAARSRRSPRPGRTPLQRPAIKEAELQCGAGGSLDDRKLAERDMPALVRPVGAIVDGHEPVDALHHAFVALRGEPKPFIACHLVGEAVYRREDLRPAPHYVEGRGRCLEVATSPGMPRIE